MATTFSVLYTDVMNRVGWPTDDSVLLTRAKRIINQVCRDIAVQRPWSDLQRRGTLTLFEPVTTGYVDLTNGSAVVADGTTSPTFQTNAVAAGMKFKAGTDEIYEITSVDAETQITLTANYQGATATDVSYKIWKDEYALAADFDRPLSAVSFLAHRRIRPIGLRELRERYPWPAEPDNPRFYSLIKAGARSADKRLWDLLLYPPPDGEEMIPYEYISSYMAYTTLGVPQAELSADTDEPWMGERFRHVVIWGAISEIYRDYKDDPRSAEAQNVYQDLIRRMANDEEPTHDRPRLLPRNTKMGLTRARRYPRYDLYGRFDRME